jgi:hypothetical protein
MVELASGRISNFSPESMSMTTALCHLHCRFRNWSLNSVSTNEVIGRMCSEAVTTGTAFGAARLILEGERRSVTKLPLPWFYIGGHTRRSRRG